MVEYSQAPHSRPSISMLRTERSSASMSVSSSHGFTSRMMFDLAMICGFFAFFAAYAARLQSTTNAN